MRPVRALLVYLAVVFLGGALLAPWLYFLAQWAAPHSGLAAHPFHRFLDRSLLGLALIGLWPFLRVGRMNSWRQLGLPPFRPHRAEFARGCLIGIFSLWTIGAAAVACGARTVTMHHGGLAGALAAMIGTAVLVSVLEELLFRGALFGLLRQSFSWPTALVVSSVIFGLAHFLQKADLPGPVTWRSGLELLPGMFRNFADFQALIPAFLNLTLVGAALALAYQRTGALYCSLGLHAAWIFSLKFFFFTSDPAPRAALWLWGSGNILDGWMVAPGLVAAILLIVRWTPAPVP
ncbi:MAG TPA: CPBP family intramembrane glutamic endopeptidase [Verrucomicrobiae bacterium]|jgi:hypothetical protein|nr:CPBP family intramembrane glutamic endopeptidase [Verrucomicrobiae bacterium]